MKNDLQLELLSSLDIIRSTKHKSNKSICKKISLYKKSDLEVNYIKIYIDKKHVFIKVIDLISKCSDYEPFGRLLWIPDIKRFGFYDDPDNMLYFIDLDNEVIEKDLYNNINKNWERDNTCISIIERPNIFIIPKNKSELKEMKENSIENHYLKITRKSYSKTELKCYKLLSFLKKTKLTFAIYTVGILAFITSFLAYNGILDIDYFIISKFSFPLMLPFAILGTIDFYLKRYESYNHYFKYIAVFFFTILLAGLSIILPLKM